ncbi:MAG: SHOCT domain-containing protein [Bacteroidetes bacterium]|nr:SHOCT domain-containing protein [Bacteroidota bacterium]
MLYDGYHFWGMHLIWWFIWIVLIFWIFALPYDIPGQRKKPTPLMILQNLFVLGKITQEEFKERKKILDEK